MDAGNPPLEDVSFLMRTKIRAHGDVYNSPPGSLNYEFAVVYAPIKALGPNLREWFNKGGDHKYEPDRR